LNGLEIGAILITPVQRLPRYVMLLQDLVKNTPLHHPDASETKQALETMSEVTEFVNAEKRIAENMYEIMEIQNMLPSSADLLVTRDRALVKKGIIRDHKKGEIHFFLFTDIILFTQINKGHQITSIVTGSQRKLKEKDRCRLDELDPFQAKGNTVEAKTPSKEWKFVFGTDEEALNWHTDLQAVIRKCPPRPVRKTVSYELKLSSNERTPLVNNENSSTCCQCSIM